MTDYKFGDRLVAALVLLVVFLFAAGLFGVFGWTVQVVALVALAWLGVATLFGLAFGRVVAYAKRGPR